MRGGSFVGLVNGLARAAARAEREAEAEHKRQLRYEKKMQREVERQHVLHAKEARQRYLEEQAASADEQNAEIAERVSALRNILEATLNVDDTISFDVLRNVGPAPVFSPHVTLLKPLPPPKEEQYIRCVQEPKGLAKLWPGSASRHQAALALAQLKFRHALNDHEKRENERQQALVRAKKEFASQRAAYESAAAKRKAQIDEFEDAYRSQDPLAVAGYCTMVLERSSYPEGIPHEFRVAYVPESKQIVVDYQLPSLEIIPKVGEVRYVKTRDCFDQKPRKQAEIRELYKDIVSAITLRTCHELFEADQGQHIAVIVFSGFVHTVDPSSGRDVRPYLISLRVTRERFEEIDLSRVEKAACLRNLGAHASSRPDEIQPVKPIVEFDMVDKRFIEQSDVLAGLESRPNLMDLNPYEFEHLVSNLFKELGLETKLTRSSRDGGVDVVAFDIRPIIGGKVVIQAKRYRNTVGVAAVRDLFGTMMNEGANKGILVTTSGYGPDAFQFAKDKPIELLDGGRLLYLLDQIGVKARIIFPLEGV